MSNFYMITNHAITIIINDEQFTFSESQPFYELLKDMLSINNDEKIDWDEVYELIHPKQKLLNYSGKTITIEDNKFYYKSKTGKKIKISENAIVSRIINLYEAGKKYDYMISFLDNVASNPDLTAINELYLFLEDCSLPITSDGYFLAYKAVRNDYYDHYSKTILNKPNTIIKMNRDRVNNNRNQTCSTGLHFCAKGYLDNYNKESSKIIIMKINPKDVVSIPSDYNNMKGRCCEYYVVGELDDIHTKIDDFIDMKFPEEIFIINEENPSEIISSKKTTAENKKEAEKKSIDKSFATKENPFKGNCKDFVKSLSRENRDLNRSYYLENSGKLSEYKFIKTVGDRAFKRIKIEDLISVKGSKEFLKIKGSVKVPNGTNYDGSAKNIDVKFKGEIETLKYPDGTAIVYTLNGKTVKIEWEGNIKRFLRSFDKKKRVTDVDIIVKNSKFISTYRFIGKTSEDYLKKIK